MDTSGIQIFRPAVSEAASNYISSAKGVEKATDAGFGFGDLLDIVNPLQHIPGVSSVYRALTGDQMSGFSNIVGSTLFGGPVGGGMALANEILEEASGNSIEGHIKSTLFGKEADPEIAASVSDSYKTVEDKTSPNKQRSTTQSWMYAGTHLA